MTAHQQNQLAGMEEPDAGETEFDTDTTKVGRSRKKPIAKKRISLSDFDLNDSTRTTKVSWNPTAGKTVTYQDLKKTFYDVWAPMNESHVAEVTRLVDQAVDEKAYDIKTLEAKLKEIKDMETIRQMLMFLSRHTHQVYNQKENVANTPLYRQLHNMKGKLYFIQDLMKKMPPDENGVPAYKDGVYDGNLSFAVPHYNEFGFPIPFSNAPASVKAALESAALQSGEAVPNFWERAVRYEDLVNEISVLEKKVEAFAFPDVKQDWNEFERVFPKHSDQKSLAPLLKVCSHYEFTYIYMPFGTYAA